MAELVQLVLVRHMPAIGEDPKPARGSGAGRSRECPVFVDVRVRPTRHDQRNGLVSLLPVSGRYRARRRGDKTGQFEARIVRC